MASVRPFHRYRGESSFTLPQIVGILKEQIPQVVPAQTKYKVTDVPTERTIRFYTARGLVDKPVGRDGANSRYGYRHVLQVLAVKYLQSHYLPLVKIKSLVANVSNRDLELMIPDIVPISAAHRGLAREDRRIVEQSLRPVPAQPRASSAAAAPEEDANAIPHDAWHRIEVTPGVELHIHTAALTAENRERLRGALLREIGTLRGWLSPRDGG